jgi:hypothetical protein
MARRSVPPSKPKTPILTIGQKRRRIERLRTCVTKLEAFDLQRVRNRALEVLELEAAIDKALSSAFGYGTPAYLRYNEAATLDPSPLLTNVTVRAPVSSPPGPTRRDAKVQETRQQFSVNKARAIALLQNAIGILEEEIGGAEPVVAALPKSEAGPVIASEEPPQVSPKSEVRTPSPRALSGFVGVLQGHVGRWWRGRSR